MCRYGVALVTVALGVMAGCKDKPAPTQIDVEIFSTVAHLDRIHLQVRDQSVDRVLGYTWSELDVTEAATRDLTVSPALIRLQESDALKGKLFLLFASGYVTDSVTGTERLTVAGSITLRYEEHATQEKRVRLSAEFLGSDKDRDGFRVCGNNPVPTDPAEQGAFDDTKACDCNDSNDRMNPFNHEICGDNADNNCTGWPYDEGCTDCVTDQPCTDLPSEQWIVAGIGQCKLGVRRCVNQVVSGVTKRVLSDVCEGWAGPTVEVLGDGKDNDCDGAVDEGGTCTTGMMRPCFLGFIETEAQAKAVGVCVAGTQSCVAGAWSNQCVGETLPQRPPRDANEQDNIATALWTGIGFFELEIPSRGLHQCDGLDNNCDGFFDEAPSFDFDSDGFTFCGTNDAPPPPARFPFGHTTGDVAAINKDCNDNDPAVFPGAIERCDDTVDNDCSCDHGPAISSPTSGVVSGDDCQAPDTYLDCSRTSRVSTPSGGCDETAGGAYYTGYGNSPTRGDHLFGCYPCRASYGLTCGANGDTCSIKSEACCVAGACPSQSLVDAGDATHAGAIFRPFCAEPDANTCVCTTGPSWHAAAAGTLPNNAGAPLDDRLDCGAITCSTFYKGIDATSGRCYRWADIPAANATCLGKPLCAPGDTSTSCCNGTTGANCCEGGERCTTQGAGAQGAEASPPRAVCMQVAPGTCVGTTGPTYQPVPLNQDPFGDCGPAATCNGAGACKQIQGSPCSGGTQCASGFCSEEGACCASSCTTACMECTTASGGVCLPVVGTKANDSTCNGACNYCNGSTCATRGGDDNVECGACQRCDGSATTCQMFNGATGNGCNSSTTYCCAGTCVSPGAEFGAGCGSGDCGGGTWGCSGASARCSKAGSACGECNADNTRNGTCANDGSACNASDVQCPACESCQDNGTSASCSAAFYGDGTIDASGGNQCLAPNSCDGFGNCVHPLGTGCLSGTECDSGHCVDGVCCDVTACGTCQTCNGGAPGSCTNIDVATDPGTCTGGSWCCNGTCVNPASSANGLGGACGGDCGGTWTCSGSAYKCSAQGTGCGVCSGENAINGTCDVDGNCTVGTSSLGCTAVCTQCVDQGASATCGNTPPLVDDAVLPNRCTGTTGCTGTDCTCDGFAVCKRANGAGCSNGGQCASGNCNGGNCQ